MLLAKRCLLLWLLAVPSLWAQDAGTAQKALAKAQFMLRQATSEKAQLQQQLESLQQQIGTLQAQLFSLEAAVLEKQRGFEKKFSEADGQWRARNEKAEKSLQSLREQLLAQTEQGTRLAEQLRRQTDNFDLCYSNNKKLYSMNRDLLERYQNKGFVDVMKQKEPFTGEARVAVENLIQDYQYQLQDLTVGASSGAAGESQKAGP